MLKVLLGKGDRTKRGHLWTLSIWVIMALKKRLLTMKAVTKKHKGFWMVVVVQSLSRVPLFVTLWTPGFLVLQVEFRTSAQDWRKTSHISHGLSSSLCGMFGDGLTFENLFSSELLIAFRTFAGNSDLSIFVLPIIFYVNCRMVVLRLLLWCIWPFS